MDWFHPRCASNIAGKEADVDPSLGGEPPASYFCPACEAKVRFNQHLVPLRKGQKRFRWFAEDDVCSVCALSEQVRPSPSFFFLFLFFFSFFVSFFLELLPLFALSHFNDGLVHFTATSTTT